MQNRPTIAKNNNTEKQITKYQYFVTFWKVQLKCTLLQVKKYFFEIVLCYKYKVK